MEETAPAGMFAFTGPVLYATSAVVITAAALVFGYLYTQKHAKQVAKTTTKDGKTADAHKTKGKDGKQKTVDSSVPLGTWPVDGGKLLVHIPYQETIESNHKNAPPPQPQKKIVGDSEICQRQSLKLAQYERLKA